MRTSLLLFDSHVQDLSTITVPCILFITWLLCFPFGFPLLFMGNPFASEGVAGTVDVANDLELPRREIGELIITGWHVNTYQVYVYEYLFAILAYFMQGLLHCKQLLF